VLKRLVKAGEVHLVPNAAGERAYRSARIRTIVLDNPDAQMPFGAFPAPWIKPRKK
jgi:hypothetical protein